MHVVDTRGFDGAEVGPGVQGQRAEDSLEVDGAGANEAMGQQMESKVGIRRVDGRRCQIVDDGAHCHGSHPAKFVAACSCVQRRDIHGLCTEAGSWKPDIQDGVPVDGRQTQARRRTGNRDEFLNDR